MPSDVSAAQDTPPVQGNQSAMTPTPETQAADSPPVDTVAVAAESIGVPDQVVSLAEDAAGPDVTAAAQALADDEVHVQQHLEDLIAAGKARVSAALGPTINAFRLAGLSHLAVPLHDGILSAFGETLSHLMYGGRTVVVPQPVAEETPAPPEAAQ